MGKHRAILCASLSLLLLALPVRSHEPITTRLTWTQEVSRVVYKRCVGCHRPEGSAFSLLTYDEARPWAKAIRDQVRTGRMPPWGAVKGVGEFSNDASLSTPEVDLLVGWVEGGAPEGDPAFLTDPPKPPKPAAPPKLSAGGKSARESKAKEWTGTGRWVAKAPVTLESIAAAGTTGALEVWVERANGGVERLLWVPDVERTSGRPFILRNPLKLRPGEVVHLTSSAVLAFRSGL